MAFIRLLQRKPDGKIVFREPTSRDVPAYAILSHTWGKEEAGWRKIQFCANQAAADGLEYFWVDTCCIDKKNVVELGNAARCYVYLSDVSKPDIGADDQSVWEEAFRKSRWLVDFFSSEGERLGSKLSLESKIHEITGIANKALRGDALSNFSIKERRSWAECRNTTIEEDGAYCLIGIFDVATKLTRIGADFEQFAVGLDLARHKEKYIAIFWYHPSTSVLSSVDLDKDLDQVVSVVKAWLDFPGNIRWLMIYDNFDNPKTPGNPDSSAVDIRQFFPRQGKRIHVQKLPDVREGLEILSNMSGRGGIKNDNTNKLDPDAIALVKELDGLPLALSTAGAYLEHVTTSFSDYLRLYKESWLKLQTTTSAKLLKLWAYFDRQDLCFDLLRHAYSTDELIQKLTNDELNFNEAIMLLCNFGLVDPDPSPQQVGPRGYSVHSCVHSWTVSVLNREWDESLARLALTCVASKVPTTDEKDWWLSQRRILQHATRQNVFIVDGKLDMDGLYWAFHNLGLLYKGQSKLAEAEKMYIRALQGNEEALGSDHISTLNTVNSLGNLYADQGKLAEAEKMYFRALQGCEEALGPDHISTLDTVNNLGLLYANQGKLAKAEKMYVRALQGCEEALGPDHISTLSTVNNLGNLYADRGKLAEAEKMYIRALQGKEEALGPDHMSTLDTLASSYLPALDTVFSLGDLFSQTDRKDMAKAMYNRALSGYRIVQGPSSKRCRQLEDRLQELQFASAESKVGQDELTEPGVAKPRPFKRKRLV
ncbi:Tetratricopeptide repeat domain containing protein [Hyaloscypha variabilis]